MGRHRKSGVIATCKKCSSEFDLGKKVHLVCDECRKIGPADTHRELTRGNIGAASEMIVSAKLILDGWSVFRSVGANSSTDVIACKNGIMRFIEIRTARRDIAGKITFPKKVAKGHPRPTEFAAVLICEDRIEFFPVES